MRKYKIELTQSEKFVVDVLAENETQAKEIVSKCFNEIVENEQEHYYSQTGGMETELSYVYDVSETDDPFDPEN